MVVDLDQGVVVDQGVPLSAVETVEAWIVDWNNIKTLSIQIQTSKEATQVVRDLHQVELRRQVQEQIYRLKMQVTLTVWIKLDSNNSVQIQLNRRIKSQRLQLILSARVCRLEE
jgi:beta-lactamase class D